MANGLRFDDDIVPVRPGWEPQGSGAGYQPPPTGGWTAPAPQTSPPPSPGSGASSYGFDDPTGQFADIPVGSPQWYAQMSMNPGNTEQMIEEATGKNITQEWLDEYAEFLPTYDPTEEQFAEGRYNLAQERYGAAGDAYQQQLGNIFSQAGRGTSDLLSSWAGGGQTMTGRKARQRSSIGEQVGMQTSGARQTYKKAGMALADADIRRAADIYGMRDAYARELRGVISDLSQQEAFVDLYNLLENTNYINPYATRTSPWTPHTPVDTWNPDTNTWSGEDDVYYSALMNRPLLEEDRID